MIFTGKNKEQQILDLFRHGNTMAMERLYSEYSGYLTGVCSRYVTDDDDVKDILQESFIKIYSKISMFEYRGKGSLKAWLVRIAVNEALSFLRHQSTNMVSDIDENIPDVPDDDINTDGINEETLVGMIQQLPQGYRNVFNLFVIEEKSHNEIAEILNIKPATSASQFHRAKNMMAKMIRDYQQEKEKK